MESTAWAGERFGADQAGLEAVIEQLIEDQKKYERRLQKLEAIIMNAYPIASAPDYPKPDIPGSFTRPTEQLASLPIEPEVIIHPRRKKQVSSDTIRARRMVTPAGQDEPAKHPVPSRPQRPAGDNSRWVINLGSYSKKNVADRMLAEFRRQDIAAEQITAIVNDMTMYRVRIAGFETWQAAMDHAQTLQERLGIADVWIAHK